MEPLLVPPSMNLCAACWSQFQQADARYSSSEQACAADRTSGSEPRRQVEWLKEDSNECDRSDQEHDRDQILPLVSEIVGSSASDACRQIEQKRGILSLVLTHRSLQEKNDQSRKDGNRDPVIDCVHLALPFGAAGTR